MKNADAGKEVCFFLEKKLTLFDQYLSITERMKATFRNKEAGNLGVLISERQGCITKIEGIDTSMEKVIKESPDKLSQISDQVNTPTQTLPLQGGGEGGGEGLVDSCLMKIKGIMEKIDLIDQEFMAMLKEEGEHVRTELLKMRNVRQAGRGYKRERGFSPRFLDTVR